MASPREVTQARDINTLDRQPSLSAQSDAKCFSGEVANHASGQRGASVGPVRATLLGDNNCEAEGRAVRAHSPVLGMCRLLVNLGYDPDRPLEAYRGPELALRIRSIGQGAKLTVRENSKSGPYVVAWVPFDPDGPLSHNAPPPVARNGEAGKHWREPDRAHQCACLRRPA